MVQIKGLTTKEVAEHLKTYGENKLPDKEDTQLQVLINQFKNPLVYLLVFATVISIWLQNYTDAIVTFIIIIVNSIIGFTQEYRAHEAYKKLSKMISSNAQVLRNGERVEVDKSQLVPDDILYIKLGDIIPADCYILEANNLSIDESSLTGESTPIYKTVNPKLEKSFHDGILFAGSHVIKGTATAKIYATGERSKFGAIANLSIQTKKPSEYENNVRNLGRDFLYISITALVFIFVSHLIFNKRDDLGTILLFTVAIAITIIPEALPVVVNLTLSKSAIQLSKKKVIVKRSSAIEDMGNIDIICSDKTGTLTMNQLAIDYFETELKKEDFYKYSYLSCAESTDSIDLSIYNYLRNTDHFSLDMKGKYEDFKDTPFDPVKKFSMREYKDFKIIKGAPEYIFGITKLKDEKLMDLISRNEHSGLRAISFSLQKQGDKHPKYIGTYFFYDVIRTDADDIIKKARKLGVNLKIITGDSHKVSIFVGKRVGLIKSEDEVIEAKDMHFDDPHALQGEVLKYSIFSRCDPVQKYKIIETLQKTHFVGYMGDGINDAPSLKLANVSIVVNNASDIAKANADIILLDKSLEVIVDGIVEGRKTFENIDKYIKQTLAGNFGGFFTIGLMSLFINFLPMLPIQILLSNLLSDMPSLTISTDNVDDDEIHKPKSHNIGNLIKFGVIFGVFSSLFDIIFFFTAKGTSGEIQTQWFTFSVITELFVFFSLRTKKFIFSPNSSKPSQAILIFTFAATLITIFIAMVGIGSPEFSTIGVGSLIFVFTLTLAYVAVNEASKRFLIQHFLPHK